MINKDQRAGRAVSTGSADAIEGSANARAGSTGGAGSDPVGRLCGAAEPATLAGSLLAAPPQERAGYATRLVASGAWVHLDLIDHAYPLGAGVSPELLAELAELRDQLDVHLLVSDPVDTLTRVLVHRPARVTLQLENVPPPREPYVAAAARACSAVGTQLWVGIAPQTGIEAVDEVRSSSDGVLVMLAEPGRAGTVADRSLVSRVAALRETPCGVDGGVTERAFTELNAAGVDHIVMGRRLWALALAGDDVASHPSAEKPDDEHSTKRSK